MISLKHGLRALPRRCSFQSIQYLQCVSANPSRALLLPSPTRQLTSSNAYRQFSTTWKMRQSEGEVNQELSAKLESELSLEKDMQESDRFPAHLKEYLDNSAFKIQDMAGKEEVVLTRTFGDEIIKVAFSIDDLNNMDDDPNMLDEEDPSMIDEMEDPADHIANKASGSPSTKGSINQSRQPPGSVRIAPEDKVAPADRPELVDQELQEDEGDQEASFPAHVSVSIERPNKGTLRIDAIAQDGLMVIDNVYYFKDSKFADPKTPDTERDARELYTGPSFGNLDEDLQVLFEKYLDERGINTTMALFIPEYIDYKEQKEYLNWLSGVKTFVE